MNVNLAKLAQTLSELYQEGYAYIFTNGIQLPPDVVANKVNELLNESEFTRPELEEALTKLFFPGNFLSEVEKLGIPDFATEFIAQVADIILPS